jgi:hypothetical protein
LIAVLIAGNKTTIAHLQAHLSRFGNLSAISRWRLFDALAYILQALHCHNHKGGGRAELSSALLPDIFTTALRRLLGFLSQISATVYYKMEALSALGLAGNVVQFTDFAGTLLSEFKSIRKTGLPDSLPNLLKSVAQINAQIDTIHACLLLDLERSGGTKLRKEDQVSILQTSYTIAPTHIVPTEPRECCHELQNCCVRFHHIPGLYLLFHVSYSDNKKKRE